MVLPRTPSTASIEPTRADETASLYLLRKYLDPGTRTNRLPTRQAGATLPLDEREQNVLSRQMQKGADRQMRMRYKQGSMPLSHFLLRRDPRSYLGQQQLQAQQGLAEQARADQQEQLGWNRENLWPMQMEEMRRKGALSDAQLAALQQQTTQQGTMFDERLTADQRMAQQNKQMLMSLLGPSLQGLMSSENPMAGMQMLNQLGRSPMMQGLFGDAWPTAGGSGGGGATDPSMAAAMLQGQGPLLADLNKIAAYGGESQYGPVGQGLQDFFRGAGTLFGGPGAARSSRGAYMGRQLREKIAQGFITPENLPYVSKHFNSQIPLEMRSAILNMPAGDADIAVLQSILRGEMPK